MPRPRRPPHPGKILRKDYLKPRGITPEAFADHICERVADINALVRGELSITASLAWKLSDVLTTGPRFWMDLQAEYDLWFAQPRQTNKWATPGPPRRTRVRRR